MLTLCFCPVVSSIFLLLFSSSNLSRRRLDVYHTSTHGVDLVQIYDSCLKRAARGLLKMQDPKITKKFAILCTIAQLWRAVSSQLRHILTIGKNLVNSSISSTCPHNMVNIGPLTAEIGLPVRGTSRHISMGFMSWLRYCTDVGHRRPIKLCTMFGRLLGWYTIYTFSGALTRWQNFARCRIHFTSQSCILLYWQRYCTALEQRLSAKLCGMVHGMELRNFRRGHHLYLAGRPSRWALAHILVVCLSVC